MPGRDGRARITAEQNTRTFLEAVLPMEVSEHKRGAGAHSSSSEDTQSSVRNTGGPICTAKALPGQARPQTRGVQGLGSRPGQVQSWTEGPLPGTTGEGPAHKSFRQVPAHSFLS